MRKGAERALDDFTAEPELGRQTSAALVEATMRNLVRIVVGYRALATLIAVAGVAGSSSVGDTGSRQLEVVTALVCVAHVWLLLLGRRTLPPPRPLAVAVDIAIAIGLNLWASSVVADGSLFYDYGNPFSGYAVAT